MTKLRKPRRSTVAEFRSHTNQLIQAKTRPNHQMNNNYERGTGCTLYNIHYSCVSLNEDG